MTQLQFFQYGSVEVEWLKSRDASLGAVIDQIGHIERSVTPDLFTALVSSIVAQQISAKANATVWGRMRELLGIVSPETISAASVESLQACGMTMRKAVYIREVAELVASGELDLENLHQLSDQEVCDQLVQIRGIGVWTAEMLLTFSMQRMNIMSWGDLAIQRGLRMLYRHRKITPALFAKYKRRYSPYATVASLYLWAIAGGATNHLSDPAVKAKSDK
ncbi:MAG: DNA-3-methyladenine glycosylase 2 family protein [Coriobacteriaceae bacterium]|nr:DNA-3-methyladenine glycosylase 2 family protein [Coriobacteriaceae bacterium]